MVMEFSSSVVSPSFIHTVSFVVTSLSTFADMLSSDDALRDMLESEMTTTLQFCCIENANTMIKFYSFASSISRVNFANTRLLPKKLR